MAVFGAITSTRPMVAMHGEQLDLTLVGDICISRTGVNEVTLGTSSRYNHSSMSRCSYAGGSQMQI